MAAPDIQLRAMTAADRAEIADLICVSTNYWYRASGKPAIFTNGPAACAIFCDVYEDLDPGCCVVAQDRESGRLMGSCFYHPRDTHVSLGIMNVHPNYFGQGVARRLLGHITAISDKLKLPTRLVSSAMNLDSFSLYTRAGFVARRTFQDMFIQVPQGGLRASLTDEFSPGLACSVDLPAIARLEQKVSGIRREKDWAYFLENRRGIWRLAVTYDGSGRVNGALASVQHPGCTMLGPGVFYSEAAALELILWELDHHRGRAPVFLVPVECGELVRALYAAGAKNCEIHLSQVRGISTPARGVEMPTFMPETA